MHIVCIDKQSLVQSVNMQYIPREGPEIFHTVARRVCLCLEYKQHRVTWGIWGFWISLPQNRGCDALKHSVNAALSIHRSPTRESW